MLQRLKYIDRLKGFAIILVIMGHYECYILGKFGVIFEIIGSFHMPLFMFLSGYVLTRKYTFRETGRNILKLLAPFFVIGILYSYCIKSNFYGMLSSPFKYGYWYLYVLAICRLLLYVGQSLSRIISMNSCAKNEFLIEAFLLLLFWGAFQLLNINVGKTYNDLFSIWITRQYFLFFCMGYISRRYNLLKRLSEKNYTYSICLVAFIIVCYLYISGFSHLIYACAPLLIGWLSYIFIKREDKSSFIEKMLEIFGKKSFDIYVYHYFILALINLSTLGYWFDSTGNVFLEALLGLLLSVLIAFVTILIGSLVRQSVLLKMLLFI